MPTVYVIGTCDTKGEELAFAVDRVRGAGAKAVLVDVSTTPFAFMADVSAETVAACHPQGATAVLGQKDRGVAVAAMGLASEALAAQTKEHRRSAGLGRFGKYLHRHRGHAGAACGCAKADGLDARVR